MTAGSNRTQAHEDKMNNLQIFAAATNRYSLKSKGSKAPKSVDLH